MKGGFVNKNADSISGGIFLIGLGLLFWVGWFWPGILLLVGITGMVHESLRGKVWNGLTSLLIMGGLTAVFSLNWSWTTVLPIALIAIGLLGLVNAWRGR